MQIKPKANSVVTHQYDAENGVLAFNVLGAGTLSFVLSMASEPVRQQAMVHGFIQRISDRAAIGRDPETGKSATPQDKLAAMQELVTFYETGTSDWSMVTAGGPRGGMLFKALCRMFDGKKTADEIRDFLDGISRKEQDALRRDPAVAAVIATIEAEMAESAPKVDTDALLAQLQS